MRSKRSTKVKSKMGKKGRVAGTTRKSLKTAKTRARGGFIMLGARLLSGLAMLRRTAAMAGKLAWTAARYKRRGMLAARSARLAKSAAKKVRARVTMARRRLRKAKTNKSLKKALNQVKDVVTEEDAERLVPWAKNNNHSSSERRKKPKQRSERIEKWKGSPYDYTAYANYLTRKYARGNRENI